MEYCPHCGLKLGVDDPKFCPHCGKNVSNEAVIENNALSDNQEGKGSVYLQGTQFEQMIQTIIEQEGYKTEKRKRAEGISGTRNEIDIWAEKDKNILLIECKNYSATRSVGTSEVRNFKSKLDDLRQMHSSDVKGLFVTSSHFSTEAEQYAKHNVIELWDGSQVYAKYYKIMLGRGQQNISIPLVLPIVFGYEDAIRSNLVNSDLVAVKRINLKWRPYFKIDYRIDVVRTLPNRNVHKTSDESFVVYDGATNESLSHRINSILYDDITKIRPEANYSVEFDDAYHTDIVPQKGPLSVIKKLAVRRIVDEYTREVDYQVRSRDGYTTKSIRVVPSNGEVLIKDMTVIYVPKWFVTLEIGGIEYKREMHGASGAVSYDQLASCSKNHGFFDKLRRYDERAYAICERCYKQFCKVHTVNVHNRYYCKDHDPTPKK